MNGPSSCLNYNKLSAYKGEPGECISRIPLLAGEHLHFFVWVKIKLTFKNKAKAKPTYGLPLHQNLITPQPIGEHLHFL